MQNGSLMSVMRYESVRDYVIHVANQKAAMSQPKPVWVLTQSIGRMRIGIIRAQDQGRRVERRQEWMR